MTNITHDLKAAMDQLLHGEVVAIPTETVYGLAGNAENETALLKIFSLKNRPLNHPLIVHIGENWDLSPWVEEIPDYAQMLMQNCWPGPMTLVLKAKTGVFSPLVTGGQSTVAIRCPDHPLAQQLLDSLGFPLVAPSANPFGKISPTTAKHVQESFPHQNFLILDGGRCSVGIESTIIDATQPSGYQILRQGMLDELQLQELVTTTYSNAKNTIRVPGKLANHYQPEKPLYCFETLAEMQDFCQAKRTTIYVLSFSKEQDFPAFSGHQLPLDAAQLAYELYYQLRCADSSEAEILVIQLPPDTAPWQGLRERILKASSEV